MNLTIEKMNELTTTPEPSVAIMLQGALANIQSGQITPQHVDVLGRMMDLYERDEKRRAEVAFSDAFSQLQSELPVIVATSSIPNRGKYERYEDVWRVVGPLLAKYGFSVAFTQEHKEGRIFMTCILAKGAHRREHSFGVKPGGKADSETQSDCKASTTAKRNALLAALNIVIRQDVFQDEENDATLQSGGEVGEEVGILIQERLQKLNRDAAKFLEWAGAPTFAKIKAARLPEINRMIDALEAKAK